jgi:predicted transcriptional regulator YdeE
LGVPEITLEKLEEEAKANIGKELEQVRQKLQFYQGIEESPEYEEAPIVRTEVKRKPYRALAMALAEELGISVPKSAKTVGKTWKEIYQELLRQKNKRKHQLLMNQL